jgi:hypothetical protein
MLAEFVDHGLHHIALHLAIPFWVSRGEDNLAVGLWDREFVWARGGITYYVFRRRNVRQSFILGFQV